MAVADWFKPTRAPAERGMVEAFAVLLVARLTADASGMTTYAELILRMAPGAVTDGLRLLKYKGFVAYDGVLVQVLKTPVSLED